MTITVLFQHAIEATGGRIAGHAPGDTVIVIRADQPASLPPIPVIALASAPFRPFDADEEPTWEDAEWQ